MKLTAGSIMFRLSDSLSSEGSRTIAYNSFAKEIADRISKTHTHIISTNAAREEAGDSPVFSLVLGSGPTAIFRLKIVRDFADIASKLPSRSSPDYALTRLSHP